MQTTIRKSNKKEKETTKQDTATPRKTKDEEATKKSTTTPRSFVQKTSTVDIYGQKKKTVAQATRAPKKVVGTTGTNNATPVKDYLKSSSSAVSQISNRSVYEKTPTVSAQRKLNLQSDSKTSLHSVTKPTRNKDLPFTNVTVNSPMAKRKSASKLSDTEKNKTIDAKDKRNEVDKRINNPKVNKEKKLDRGDSKEIGVERQRTKTRTLDEGEAKVVTAEAVDNNTEMKNLAKRLTARPKAFYVDLVEQTTKIIEKTSDDDVSYEDDFESYESDFNSYHSDQSANAADNSDEVDKESDGEEKIEEDGETAVGGDDGSLKEGKDEEKMLDSGTYELRDRSAKSRPFMDLIQEDFEDDKRQSLTDEGFQDMSSSSGLPSVKGQTDVLDRPLFIDFNKSNENKRKRKINDKLRQRATDLLSMITLHEMSYSLFEMKPIAYDQFMATFGRSNYTQVAVQTFDDGITEEIQTEEILSEHKWTQHPIDFSKSDIYLYPKDGNKTGGNGEDYLSKFSKLLNKNFNIEENEVNIDKSYKENPLRIYFEQKDGVGACEMLPFEKYKRKLENNDFDVIKLSKFLKKAERRLSNVLSINSDKDLVKYKNSVNQKIPLSKGYMTISPKNMNNDKLSFIKSSKISNLIISTTKRNLIMLVHEKTAVQKCIICLWDISVARNEPIKVLVAIDNVSVGRFKGNMDGILIAALDDGSLHLWDLSEEPTWRQEETGNDIDTDLKEVTSDKLSQTEMDREWNQKNVHVRKRETLPSQPLQVSAYTSSAANMMNEDVVERVVGLEFLGGVGRVGSEGARRVAGQVCMLQRIGILTIWSIIQDKSKTNDIGKAYWSKMKLERIQTISLLNHIDIPIETEKNGDEFIEFNLNSAKRRLSMRKKEKKTIKTQLSRPKSTSSSEFDISRPASAASVKKVLPLEKKVHESWENVVLCSDLKVMRVDGKESYLVAKNCGEVLCCSRIAGSVKVKRFCVSTDTSSVTRLSASPHGLPYFLAATDSGTINLCSVVDSKVLLTLDCRNGPPPSADKCESDHKGRFVSSSRVRPAQVHDTTHRLLPVSFLHWASNPCVLYSQVDDQALQMWDLTHSDIYAKSSSSQAGCSCVAGEGVLALLTPEHDVQVHRMTTDHNNQHHLDLFRKYITLL